MSGLEKLAQGPLGSTLGGFLEGEIEENRLEKILEQKKDDSKAGLVTYASQKIIDNYTDVMGVANKKIDAIEALKSQGLPLYFIHENMATCTVSHRNRSSRFLSGDFV